jgi:transposase-like protein
VGRFEIERYRRRESSVEEALIEMYLAGFRSGGWRTSPKRCGAPGSVASRISPSTVSNLNKKIYAKIEAWRHRSIEGEHPYPISTAS